MSAGKKGGKSAKTDAGAATGNTPGDAPSRAGPLFSGKYRDWWISAALFFSALFLIITVSNPGLYLNDEWITVNQVHQLDTGHQIIVNEGKYGMFKNGTPAPYFVARDNTLMYSLALPVSSMPAMKLIDLFGENFRLILVLSWSFLPLLVALIFSGCYPARAAIGSVRLTLIAAVAGFLLFAVNLLVYSPFPYSAADAPVEVAAVVFTNHLFFALTVAMTYLIARRIFDGRWMAVFAAMSGAACSAYLFWGANAKDHMATAAVFAVVLYFFVCYFQTRRIRDVAGGFAFIGILSWFRPEVGFAALVCIGLFFIADNLLRVWQHQDSLKHGAMHIGAILFTAVGAIPFFLNNIVVTGNPLVPVFLREVVIMNGAHGGSAVSAVTGAGNAGIPPASGVSEGLLPALGHYVFSLSADPLGNLFGILVLPQSGSMGLFLTLPIALLALILLPFILIRSRVTGVAGVLRNRELFVLMLAGAAAILLAYMHDLAGLNASHGIGPDIRYLSPLYIPVLFLSLMILQNTVLLSHPRELVRKSCILGVFMVPATLVIMILSDPVWNTETSNYLLFFRILIFAAVLGIAVMVLYYLYAGRPADALSDRLLPLLILTILSWQVLMIFLVSPVAKFNGYTFWIPGIDFVYHYFIRVTILP